jgi:DNA-binding XRE family transcriptional regulator
MTKKLTAGQKLLAGLYKAESHATEAAKVAVPPGAARINPLVATKRWSEGMSRHLKDRFASGIRDFRERLGLTQQDLADRAGVTGTAVAMIERGERAPNLDTATRLCWALDVAAGVTATDLY